MDKPDATEFVDWGRIRAQGDAEAVRILGQLANLENNPFTAERVRIVGETVRAEIARHRPGAQARAAKVLNLSPALLGRLYTKYKEHVLIEIASVASNYDLLNEVEDHFDNRQAAHDAIQTYLGQIIDIDGEDTVVVDRKPLTNASGRTIGETLWVTEEAADTIRDAIAAAAE